MNKVVNDSERFAVSIDVSHFKPEELKVNLEGRVLSIEASQEKKDENNFFQRSFARRWTLPEDVDLTAISSSITPEGCLAIEAPKKGKDAVKSIPIVRAVKQ